MQAIEKHGPFGSNSPPNWNVILEERARIKEIIIRYGFIVDSIGFLLEGSNGRTTAKLFGGRGGACSKITLKPDEYITQISGRCGIYVHSHDHVIASLRIHTNLCEGGYGPYGQERDVRHSCSFSTPDSGGDDGTIVEIYGRHDGYYLRSIGVCFKKTIFRVKRKNKWGHVIGEI
ncbi:horcolin-like [Chenopodium quinoa]|uniref:horcolin-like n=1 Tax=Chenopodium quinoa TaxID=63459 RepID=UPI000B787303|nr:horcolin-like [Chenopodium quinoa]XP_021763667.1 horcolin-like [Chenopodium quinoa]